MDLSSQFDHNRHVRQILDSVGEGICGLNRDGSIQFANPAAAKILGCAVQELLGVSLHEKIHRARPNGANHSANDCAVCQTLATGTAGEIQLVLYRRRAGGPISIEIRCTPAGDGRDDISAILFFRDVTERRSLELQVLAHKGSMGDANRKVAAQRTALTNAKARLMAAHQRLLDVNSKLALLATCDGVTGLKNHRAFQERLGDETARTKRYQNPFSLMLVDIDHFKQYNDAFGHPEGDAVLKRVAAIIEETIRTSDMAARYGGEEFAVVLTETDVTTARIAAERVRVAVEGAPWTHGAITVSIGVATFSRRMESGADLIVNADRALYRSKQRGRNCATHIEDEAEEYDFCGGGNLPYTEVMREMLSLQTGMLSSAAERVKDRLIDAYDKTIESWCKILDMKDKETEGHSTRVTDLTARLARSISMNEEEVLFARWGALLHDIGKIGIPDSILLKPDTLTDDEWVIMRRHPVIAYEMLSPITFLRPALDIPYGHHEKWDGTGYPRGLKGDAIPLTARLFAVIDVYDALRSDRPYRAGWPEGKVRKYLRDQSGTHFDPRAVDAFLTMLRSDSRFGHEALKSAA